MTTLADLTLRVARLITDVVEGIATDGDVNSLTDTHLIQTNQYFDRGTLWILSGANAGKMLNVDSFAVNKVTFEAQADAIVAGDRYAIIRATYPYTVLISAINDALRETFIVAEAVSDPPAPITGDGETLAYDLPTGASHIAGVELEDPTDANNIYPSTHWKEKDGQVVFAEGFPPMTDWIVHVYTRQEHPILVNEDDALNWQINTEWLRWKAAEYALYWAVGVYGDAKEYRIEERLNRTLGKQKGLPARAPTFTVHTAGG